MHQFCKMIAGLALFGIASAASAQLVLYDHERYGGTSVTLDRQVKDLKKRGFNNKAASAIVQGGRWEVCERAKFKGKCVVLAHGRYDSLNQINFGDAISSARPVHSGRTDGPRR